MVEGCAFHKKPQTVFILGVLTYQPVAHADVQKYSTHFNGLDTSDLAILADEMVLEEIPAGHIISRMKDEVIWPESWNWASTHARCFDILSNWFCMHPKQHTDALTVSFRLPDIESLQVRNQDCWLICWQILQMNHLVRVWTWSRAAFFMLSSVRVEILSMG